MAFPALPFWFWPGDDRPIEEIDDEIVAELRLHLDLLADQQMREGRSIEEAKRDAAERFGDFDTVLRRCRAEKQGDLPMLKRVQAVLTLLLLVGVVFLGVRDYFTASTTAQYMDQTTGFLKSIQGDLALMREDMALAATVGALQSTAVSEDPRLGGLVRPQRASLSEAQEHTMVKKRVARADLVGSVRDAADDPVVDADVLLTVKTWPNNRFRQDHYALKTDASGAFVLKGKIPLDGQYGVNTAVVAEGHAIASQYNLVEDPEGQPPEELTFTLIRSIKKRVTVKGGWSNEPIAGAIVSPIARVTENDQEHLVYHRASGPVWKETDADGVITIDWFAGGDLGKVNIRPPGGEWHEKKNYYGSGKKRSAPIWEEIRFSEASDANIYGGRLPNFGENLPQFEKDD